MKRKLNISKNGNFLVAILVIHFLFFGYICYVYPEDVGTNVLYLNLILFRTDSYLSLIILVATVFLMGIREKFFEYGIRNSVWLVPIIVIESWIWYWIIGVYKVNFFVDYFYNINSYYTIVVLFIIIFFTAVAAAYIRQKYENYIRIDGNKIKD